MKTALLIVDMLNALDFHEGESLLRQARPAAKKIAELKKKARRANVPVIYINDNFGKWRSEWSEIYEMCAAENSRGRELAQMLAPDPEDYFILKPRQSGFYATPLDVLLSDLKIEQLVVTGIAANMCVLFTVHDAHVRDYKITVPKDAIAANSARLTRETLEQLKTVFKAKTVASASVRFYMPKRTEK